MKTGDIIVVDGNGLISDVIEDITDADFSHVALAIDSKHIIEAAAQGIVVRNIGEYDGNRFLVMRPYVPFNKVQSFKITEAAYAFTGTPYNWLETLWIGIKRLLHLPGPNPFYSKQRLNCVNLVVDSYAAGGVQLFQTDDPGSLVPGDFVKNEFLFVFHDHKPEFT